METVPIYLTDPYAREMTAQVQEVLPEAAGRWRVRLSQTVFYPMGGGQPTDQGQLEWADGQPAVVYQVMLKEGDIWHYLETSEPPQVGQNVRGEIKWERRFQNMRVHTAGHLIDYALYKLGCVPAPLAPTKADHGKKPFVQYAGILPPEIAVARIEAETNRLIAEDRQFSWDFVSLSQLEAEAIYLQPGLPTGKPLRKLSLEGLGAVADGGTILRRSSEVGGLKNLRLEVRDGTDTLVWYNVV